MIVYRIGPTGFNKWCEKSIDDVIKFLPEWMAEMEKGERFEIEAVEMDENDFDNLPEYTGP